MEELSMETLASYGISKTILLNFQWVTLLPNRAHRSLTFPVSLVQFLNSLPSLLFPFHDATAPSRPGPPHYRGFTIIFRHTTLLEKSDRPDAATCTWQTHNSHKRQTSMSLAGFEPAIPASERSQTHALDRATTGTVPDQRTWKFTFVQIWY